MHYTELSGRLTYVQSFPSRHLPVTFLPGDNLPASLQYTDLGLLVSLSNKQHLQTPFSRNDKLTIPNQAAEVALSGTTPFLPEQEIPLHHVEFQVSDVDAVSLVLSRPHLPDLALDQDLHHLTSHFLPNRSFVSHLDTRLRHHQYLQGQCFVQINSLPLSRQVLPHHSFDELLYRTEIFVHIFHLQRDEEGQGPQLRLCERCNTSNRLQVIDHPTFQEVFSASSKRTFLHHPSQRNDRLQKDTRIQQLLTTVLFLLLAKLLQEVHLQARQEAELRARRKKESPIQPLLLISKLLVSLKTFQ